MKYKFGFQSDEGNELVAQSSGKFGLNQECYLKSLEFNPSAGKNNAPANAIDYTILVGDREMKSRLYEPTGKMWFGSEQIDEGHPEYERVLESNMRQVQATITHILKAVGIPEERIQKAVEAAEPETFAEFAKVVCGLVQPKHMDNPIDVFLQYQWSIRPGNTVTFLEVPKNMKGGRFLAPGTDCEWKEVRDANGLHYENARGDRHPFTRSASYMTGKFANQQRSGEDDGKPSTPSNAGQAMNHSWGSQQELTF